MYIQETILLANLMAMVITNGKIVACIKANSQMAKNMAKGNGSNQRPQLNAINTKACIVLIKNLDKVHLLGKVETYIRELM